METVSLVKLVKILGVFILAFPITGIFSHVMYRIKSNGGQMVSATAWHVADICLFVISLIQCSALALLRLFFC